MLGECWSAFDFRSPHLTVPTSVQGHPASSRRLTRAVNLKEARTPPTTRCPCPTASRSGTNAYHGPTALDAEDHAVSLNFWIRKDDRLQQVLTAG